jgi:hypothetical protein
MTHYTFFQELLKEHSVDPINVSFVLDNAKAPPKQRRKARRNMSWQSTGEQQERRTRWRRMEKHDSDSELNRPIRRSSLLGNHFSSNIANTIFPPPPPTYNMTSPPVDSPLRKKVDQKASKEDEKGRWHKPIRRKSEDCLFAPSRRTSMEFALATSAIDSNFSSKRQSSLL